MAETVPEESISSAKALDEPSVPVYRRWKVIIVFSSSSALIFCLRPGIDNLVLHDRAVP
jgi:hypothetical protein